MHFAAATPELWMVSCAAVITQGRKSPLESDSALFIIIHQL